MKSKFYFIGLLLIMLSTLIQLNAQEDTIVFVAPYDPGDPYGPANREAENIKFLKGQGFVVQLFWTDYPISLAGQETIDMLNDADLVIIGRSGPSGRFMNEEDRKVWNGLTSPQMLICPWKARSNRLNWFNSIDTYHRNEEPPLAYASIKTPGDSIFKYVTLDGDSLGWFYPPHDFMRLTDTTTTNADILATFEDTCVLVARFDSGAAYYPSATDTAGGPRTYFGMGNDNTKDEYGQQVSNFFPLTDEAKAVYLAEICRLIGIPIQERVWGESDMDIIFVTPNDEWDPYGPRNREIENIEFLKNQGFNVELFWSDINLGSAGQQPIDMLNEADLVIIGRSCPSVYFQEPADRDAWNSLTSPQMLICMWKARNSRLNWFNSSLSEHQNDFPPVAYGQISAPGDPVFADLTLTGDSLPWFTPPHDFLRLDAASNATILASYVGKDPLFARFDANVPFYDGTSDSPAGPRTYFGMGNDAVPGVVNFLPLTKEARTVYIAEIYRMLGLPIEKPAFGPIEVYLSGSTLFEHQPEWTFIGKFDSRNFNPGTTHLYTFVSGTGDTDNGSFYIRNDSLFSAEMADYETKNSYLIRIRSTDADDLFYEKQFQINVWTDTLTGTSSFGGIIIQDMVWMADTVQVTRDILILDSATLTVNPGTVVEFQGYYKIDVRGSLIAVGSPSDSILFTVKDTTGFNIVNLNKGGWHGIEIDRWNYSGGNDSSRFEYCIFQYSKAAGNDKDSEGGAIWIANWSKVKISHCRFFSNTAKNVGGAICIQVGSIPIITNNLFHYNKANEGGAIFIGGADPTISGNTFYRNHANGAGGGILAINNSASIIQNFFSNNDAGAGGAFELRNSENVVEGNIIVNNAASWSGGGVFLSTAEPEFNNNTIANNYATNGGGGLGFMGLTNADFKNNILWGNRIYGEPTREPEQVRIHTVTSTPNFYSCIIEEGQSGIGTDPGVTYAGFLQDTLDSDPLFLDPSDSAGIEPDGLTADWKVSTSSPVINRGINDVVKGLHSDKDIYGNPRVLHGIIDVGATETRIGKMTVSGFITEDTRWVADTILVTGDIVVTDSANLTIAPGSTIYFEDYYVLDMRGCLLASGSSSDPIIFTVLDTTGFSDKTTFEGSWKGIIFDNSENGANGAMRNNDTSKLVNCIIEYAKNLDPEWGVTQGGALRIRYFSKLKIMNCTIRYNTALRGGGINADLYSHPLILNNLIYMNEAEYMGGGIHCSMNSNPVIRNNYIINNKLYGTGSWNNGGGLSIESSDPVVQNNVICNNYSSENGGGVQIINDAYPLFTNNTIANNYARCDGGGLYIWECEPDIYNSVIWGNYAEWNGSQVFLINDVNFYYSNIQDGKAGLPPWYAYNGAWIKMIDGDPMFTSPSSATGILPDALDADWSITSFSPNINNGAPSDPELNIPATDITGFTRINHQVIDIGAFENQDDPLIILTQPKNKICCMGDSVIFQIELNQPALYQWMKNGDTITGEISSTLTINPAEISDEANYNCVVRNGYGSAESNYSQLIVKYPPVILTQTESQWVIEDEDLNLDVNASGTQTLFYQWSKDGVNINDADELRFTINSFTYSNEGTYTCTVTNSCGQTATQPITLYAAPQICMVTVSMATGNNLIVWEKRSIAPISYFKIYRESSYSGIYDLIATIPYNQYSTFVDTQADPTKRAYLYKITAVDNTDHETDLDLCKTHKTIHLLVTVHPETKATQLDWDRYVGFEYGTYEIFRSDTTINFQSIDLMSSSTSTWSDPDPGTVTQYYRIAAVKPDTCYPSGTGGTKAESGPYSHSMSNMEDNRLQTGIFESLLFGEELMIYPNPFYETTTIYFNNPEGDSYSLLIMDLSGKVCSIDNGITASEYILNKGDLKEGFYFIELRGTKIYRGKIVIE